MEFKTCEEYVLSKLADEEDKNLFLEQRVQYLADQLEEYKKLQEKYDRLASAVGELGHKVDYPKGIMITKSLIWKTDGEEGLYDVLSDYFFSEASEASDK